MEAYFLVNVQYDNKYQIDLGADWYKKNNKNPFKSKRVAQTVAEILIQKCNASSKLYQRTGGLLQKLHTDGYGRRKV